MIFSKQSITLAAALILGALSTNSIAADQAATPLKKRIDTTGEAQQAVDFTQLKRAAALDMTLQYQQLKPILARHIRAGQLNVSLQTLQQAGQLNLSEMNVFEQEVIKAKGFAAQTTGLIELRLADETMHRGMDMGIAPLFSYEPSGEESDWTFIEAFDAQGNTHLLDVDTLPARPVIVVDINAQTDMKEGLAQMRAIFAKMGSSAAPQKTTTQDASAILETSKLTQISLNNDAEPWISGSAEIYAIVTGIDASYDDPILAVVDMPYLDHDGNTYYPNQIMIYWERYRWNAADMILMEHDDSTNYQELAIQLAVTAGEIMALIPNPTVQGLSVLGQLTSELLAAMPSSWFSNDDDYVDVFYTLIKDTTYTNYYGASANAKMSMVPFNLSD